MNNQLKKKIARRLQKNYKRKNQPKHLILSEYKVRKDLYNRRTNSLITETKDRLMKLNERKTLIKETRSRIEKLNKKHKRLTANVQY